MGGHECESGELIIKIWLSKANELKLIGFGARIKLLERRGRVHLECDDVVAVRAPAKKVFTPFQCELG